MHSPVADPNSSDIRLPLVLIVGPTAVGKTSIAIQLAERLDAEIISADSRLFYRGMDIGTAKPTLKERRSVPHHLIDIAEPDEIWSLALFQQEARRCVTAVHSRDRLPILVGGTGQYIRAVVEGWQPPRVEADPHLRRLIEAWAEEIGPFELHRRLAVLDSTASKLIDPRNQRRTVRALEVIFSTGKRYSQQRTSGGSPYHSLILGLTLPRPELYTRIDERIDSMLASGWVDEVSGLLARSFSPKLPSMSAIGYREIIEHLQGRITLDEAVQQIRRNTRIYVRRQANWFKPTDPQIHWFESGPTAVFAMQITTYNWLKSLDSSLGS